MYKIGELRGKHYGVEVVDDNGTVVLKPYYDHVESIYDLECAKAMVEKLNEMLKEENSA